MYRVLALICLCLTGCASVPETYWQINRATSERFTYVTDFEKHGVADYREEGVTGDTRFTGDCEEFSSAIQFQLAKIGVSSDRWLVVGRRGFHALTCSDDGFCFDAFTIPMRRENVPYKFISRM